MINDISLTVRFPEELDKQLVAISKSKGITKTNFIRFAIHEFLTVDNTILDFSTNSSSKRNRLVLNVNKLTYDILDKTCKKYNQSINSVVIAVTSLSLKNLTK